MKMELLKIRLLLIWMLFIATILTLPVSAQVTIGADKTPEEFSTLELISNHTKGLRLPQFTAEQRDLVQNSAAFQAEKTGEAMGLQIFNVDTHCVETWNGTRWISQCGDDQTSGQGKALNILSLSVNQDYGLAPTQALYNTTARSLLLNYNNFGTLSGSTVKVAEVTGSYITVSIDGAGTDVTDINPHPERTTIIESDIPTSNSAAATEEFRQLVAKMDIVVVALDWYPRTGGEANLDVLVDFSNNGGALLYAPQRNDDWNTEFLNRLYGTASITKATYYNTMTRWRWLIDSGTADNPILNGPFGNIMTMPTPALGNDAGDCMTISGVPASATVLLRSYDNPNEVMMFFDESKGLLWCGDGGWMIGTNTGLTTAKSTYPSSYTGSGESAYPAVQEYYATTGAPQGPVYNSFAFANAMAWAIDYAGKNRIR